MTRRSSLRAAARENYREMNKGQGASATKGDPPPSLSLPLKGGGDDKREMVRASETETPLTARVRALYETSAVPVREIALLVGVTERTIYKYVIKQNWKRRYAGRGAEAGSANRGRRWRRAEGHEPVKGAGGRFIARADKDKPVPTGLKATDPPGHTRAVVACATAARLSDAAQAKALADKRRAQCEVAHASLNLMMAEYNAFRKNCAGRRARKLRPLPLEGRLEETHVRLVEKALARWQASLDLA
jgi:hypothetical protein